MAVVASFEDAQGLRCVDVIKRDQHTFMLKEFRRDPEDGGRWNLVADYSAVVYGSEQDAVDAARSALPWFVEGRPALPR